MEKNQQTQQVSTRPSRPYVTIEYPLNDKTHDIFLRHQKETVYRMEKDGKPIHKNPIKFSRVFRDMFKNAGYNFAPEPKLYTKGKTRVFGIEVVVKKIETKDRSVIRVKIEGANVEEALNKERKIERKVREIAHIDPEIRLWERLEMC
jgi:hypothetical protein